MWGERVRGVWGKGCLECGIRLVQCVSELLT